MSKMNVLIVGSGGREHALAWKIAQSPRLGHLYAAPGNAGTASLAENVPIKTGGSADALADFARQHAIDLVVVGPEAPLAEGLADHLQTEGLAVFGPSRAAAQIEASKAFAKAFMDRHAIPTARFATFQDYDAALQHLRQAPYPVVIKASGLAAGKGVIVPESQEEAEAALQQFLVAGELGDAGSEVVIEERLSGEEVSILAFTDSRTLRLMPPAQDHKRLLDGDCGPNTGGMGAYAPAPICDPACLDAISRSVLQPAIDGMRQEGTPFVGVLYAGMILTSEGPKVLEFNCRFGDPETQALLPLLESDLLEVMQACVEGRLHEVEVRWSPGSAACVVLASAKYPGKTESGKAIHGLGNAHRDRTVFHAATRRDGEAIVTAGGRVLGVTAWGADLGEALNKAYQEVESIAFEGCQYRRDIGQRGLARVSAYTQAGVDIDAGNRAVALMKDSVRSTYGPEVLAGIGAFGGLYDASLLQKMENPVLVASTDGVGTKVRLAARVGSYASIGHDIVNHCINDILVQGARPLFFLDYIAAARLDPQVIAAIVSGIAGACREAGCALLGGETAEMPGVYADQAFDLAGTIVGIVERQRMLPRSDFAPGDLLIGLASSGPHTNGYSLIRKIFAGVDLETTYPEIGEPLSAALLAPHRSYLPLITPVLETPDSPIKGMAHITGGGFIDNIPRILPEGVGAVVRQGAWHVPPVFKLIQRLGNIRGEEMTRVFNMGIGMVLVVPGNQAQAVQASIPEVTWIIGEIQKGESRVTFS